MLFRSEYVGDTMPYVSVGEHWVSCNYNHSHLEYNQDSHRQSTYDWCNSTGGNTAAFDFTTKGILQEALLREELWRLKDNQNRASGVIGWWPTRSVTFLDNHDTGSQQAHWPFPEKYLLAGYAYILTHPGTPCLFWDHLYAREPDVATQIEEMAMLRHEFKIHSGSQLTIMKASSKEYRAHIDNRIYLILGEINSPPPLPWKERMRGADFAIFTR